MTTLNCNALQIAEEFVTFARDLFGCNGTIPLHAPVFDGREKQYVIETIDSTFVSSVGKFVDRFESSFAQFIGGGHAVATVNGTAALHIALMLAGVGANDEVITQPLTFVATCNAIRYCGAHPVFVDIDRETLGLSAEKLESFLKQHAKLEGGRCVNRTSGRTIRACLPVHTLGHPVDVVAIQAVCDRFGITLVEDAAESLGSRYAGRHTGLFGRVSAFSFNGNKTITTGGGGMVVARDSKLAERARHWTTTAKVPHPWEYVHDEIGYNYRLPNINAALGCAQMERLDIILRQKRRIAEKYIHFFANREIRFVTEPRDCQSNYWLNAVILQDKAERDAFLRHTNSQSVMTRPAWQLMTRLPMFKDCQAGDLSASEWIEERLVAIPSGVKSNEG